MRTGRKRSLSVVLIMIMVFTAVMASGAVTYAAEPDILIQPTDIWLWTDETRTIGIGLTEKADSVEIQFYDDDMGNWIEWYDCKSQNTDKTMWYFDIPLGEFTPDFVEYTERCRYAIHYDSGKTKYSEVFFITWTKNADFGRIYGANRYETAMRVAESYLDATESGKYSHVIIASGLDFADALGGTFLSVRRNAPIFLVNKSPQVIQDVAGNVQKNLTDGGRIYILGGTGAVSDEMEKALLAGGIEDWQIERFAGKNRYDTNLMILRACGPVGMDVLVCSGTNFADALSASAAGLPILLVGKSLTQEQKDFLKICSPRYVDVIGGEGAVSKAVFDQIHDELDCAGSRVWGSNRYETSAKIAAKYFSDKQRFAVTLAYGQNFPDGLAGGPLSYAVGAPLLLVRPGNEKDACDVVKYSIRSHYAIVLGGPALIPDDLVWKVLDHKPKG